MSYVQLKQLLLNTSVPVDYEKGTMWILVNLCKTYIKIDLEILFISVVLGVYAYI